MPKIKAKIRAKEYIRQKFNATETIKALEPGKSRDNTNIIAHRMLNNAVFQSALQEEMEKQGLNDEFISEITKRNIKQNDNYAASNQAMDMVNKVKGNYAPERKQSVSLNININDAGAVNERIKELQQELAALE